MSLRAKAGKRVSRDWRGPVPSDGGRDGGSVHSRCGAHRDRQAERIPGRGPPGRPRGPCPARAGGPDRDRPRRGRRRDHGVRFADRPADLRHRQECLAVGRPAGERARRHHRPAVRVVPAGGPFRRPGGDVRHPGPRGRGRRGEHEHRHHGVNRHPVRAGGHAGSVGSRLAGALRRPGDLPVPWRSADLRAVGHQATPAGGVRAGEPPASGPRHRRRPVRAGDSAAGRLRPGRGPAPGHVAGEDGRARAAPPGLGDHGRGRLADLRRSRRPAHRLGGGAGEVRPDPDGADTRAGRGRLRPGDSC